MLMRLGVGLRQSRLTAKFSSAYARRAENSTLITSFEKMVDELPYREAIRYTHNNKKFTAGDVKKHVDSLANGLLESDFIAGDTVALMLDNDIIHKHIILLAAAKLGIQVMDIHSSINTVSDLRKALALAKCNAIFFTPVTDAQDNLLLLRKTIPEFFYFDDSKGQHFHSKHFPELKYFIHTGFDIEMGAVHYHHFLLPNPITSNIISYTMKQVKDDMPLYCCISKGVSGDVEKGVAYNHLTALNADSFSFARKLLSKEYVEV